jgi:hypothetical protein
MTIQEAVKILGATPADIAGLWNAPGYPELTTGQLMHAAAALKVSPEADPIGFLQELIRPAQ